MKEKDRLPPILIERQLEQEIGIETYVSKKAMHTETARDRGMLKIQTCIHSHDQVNTRRGNLYINRQKQLKIYRGKTAK